MKIIEGMNHIFKEAESERIKNIATYNQPELPIKPELIEVITNFIRKELEHNKPDAGDSL